MALGAGLAVLFLPADELWFGKDSKSPPQQVKKRPAIADPRRFPLIDKLISLDEGKSLTSQCTLSVRDHPFLSDHAIDGIP